eukprot:6053208-Prymnesium_polylepis.1
MRCAKPRAQSRPRSHAGGRTSADDQTLGVHVLDVRGHLRNVRLVGRGRIESAAKRKDDRLEACSGALVGDGADGGGVGLRRVEVQRRLRHLWPPTRSSQRCSLLPMRAPSKRAPVEAAHLREERADHAPTAERLPLHVVGVVQ